MSFVLLFMWIHPDPVTWEVQNASYPSPLIRLHYGWQCSFADVQWICTELVHIAYSLKPILYSREACMMKISENMQKTVHGILVKYGYCTLYAVDNLVTSQWCPCAFIWHLRCYKSICSIHKACNGPQSLQRLRLVKQQSSIFVKSIPLFLVLWKIMILFQIL